MKKQQFLKAFNLDEIKKKCKSNRNELVDFERALNGLIITLSAQNDSDLIHGKTFLKFINQATNYKHFLSLTGCETDQLSQYVDFDAISSVINDLIDDNQLSSNHIVKIIDIENLVASIGCDPQDLKEYVNLDGLAKIILDRCLGKKITIADMARIKGAIDFEKIEENFLIPSSLIEKTIATYALDTTTQNNNLTISSRLLKKIQSLISNRISSSLLYGLQGAAGAMAFTLLPYLAGRAICPSCVDACQEQQMLTGTVALISTIGLGFLLPYLTNNYKNNIAINVSIARLKQLLTSKFRYKDAVPLMYTEEEDTSKYLQALKSNLKQHQKQYENLIDLHSCNPALLMQQEDFIKSLSLEQKQMLSLFIFENFRKSITAEQKLLLPKPRNFLLFKARFNPALLLDKKDFIQSLNDVQYSLLAAILDLNSEEDNNNNGEKYE